MTARGVMSCFQGRRHEGLHIQVSGMRFQSVGIAGVGILEGNGNGGQGCHSLP